MRYEQARSILLQEVERAFVSGEQILEIVHGVGTYTLRRMIEEEMNKLDYVRIRERTKENPGSLILEILGPSPGDLKNYLER